MAKAYELSESKRVAIKHLCLTRLSYAGFGRQIGCNKFVKFKVLEIFELASSVEKRRKCGHPKNWRKYGHPKPVCKVARQLRRVASIICAISRTQGYNINNSNQMSK